MPNHVRDDLDILCHSVWRVRVAHEELVYAIHDIEALDIQRVVFLRDRQEWFTRSGQMSAQEVECIVAPKLTPIADMVSVARLICWQRDGSVAR